MVVLFFEVWLVALLGEALHVAVVVFAVVRAAFFVLVAAQREG